MSRFDALNDVSPPDQWADIERRAEMETPDTRLPSGRDRRWGPALVGVAAIVVVTIAVGVSALDDGSEEVATDDESAETSDSMPPGTATTVLCPDGRLRSAAIPADASETSVLIDLSHDDQVVRSWLDGGNRIEVFLPGFRYVDFVGERTENIADPPGFFWYRAESTHFLGSTGLQGACSGYEVVVAGGDEASRRALLLELVDGFEFEAR